MLWLFLIVFASIFCVAEAFVYATIIVMHNCADYQIKTEEEVK